MFKNTLRKSPQLVRMVRRAKASLSSVGGARQEPELALLPFLVPRHRTALDVGANMGTYIEALLPLAGNVVAIEANPLLARDLAAMFNAVRIIQKAVSHTAGTVDLRVPKDAFFSGMATIEPDNALPDRAVDIHTVEMVTIDSLQLDDIGFIKIDIEGHEFAALEGATATIKRFRPNLLIESEERHRHGSVGDITKLLNGLGYSGYMLWQGALTPISQFNPAIHQSHSPTTKDEYKVHTNSYVNNFMFFPN